MLRILISLIMSTSFNFAYALSLNDVSVLLPLPNAAQKNLMLMPQADGGNGVLLPKDVYDRFPQLIPESTNEKTYQNFLKVIAIRFDPCFGEGSLVTKCRRQIRMVWQPVYTESLSTRDAAVHTFYEFNESEWSEILKSLKYLSSGSPSDALQIHPKIKAEGLEGPYWKALRELLLKFCGKNKLVRVTAMNVQFNEQMWIFMGFDVGPNGITGITIPRVNLRAQAINMSPHDTSEFIGTIRPEVPQNTNLSELLAQSSNVSSVLTESEIKEVVRDAIRFENPNLNNPGTVDCATCHIAQSVRQWAQVNYKHWDWATEFKNDVYNSKWNMTNNMSFKTNQFRAFGYFNSDAVISQRVVNESAAVLENIFY